MKIKKIYILLISILIGVFPTKIAASSILLNKSQMILGVGYTETLKYTIEEGLNDSNIIWTSSHPNVATVKNGKVTAITEGVTIITATINGQKSTCKVTVNSSYVPVSGINLNKTNLNILVGSTENLTKTVLPANATNTDATWTSSNTGVVTVENGKVTAKKVGTAIITVSLSGYSATCTVVVVDTIELKKIAINKSSITIKEQASENLSISYTPSNATNKKVNWKSSNNNVVTVNSDGKITGIKEGSATITAISKDGGHVSTCKVTVEAISKKVTGISLDKTEAKMTAGEKLTLKATISPSYAENQNISWTSSNESVATVQDGNITAHFPGLAEIKVISEDGQKEAICKVTVLSPPIKSISFQDKEHTVYIDSKTKLITITDPINASIENPIWTSSNEEVATVTNGVVQALSLGETTITISNQDNTVTASTKIIVVSQPKDKLNITIEGYDLKFNPEIKNYTLKINNENQLTINTNVTKEKVTINGNKNLKNGSIITVTVEGEEKTTYVINIQQKQNYTIYFVIVISGLLLLNIIRILIKNKKKS